MKNTLIIAAFPGCGKSQCEKDHPNHIILDSDSSRFSWIEGKENVERNPDFPNNYMKHIKENIGKADIIFISSHDVVRDALRENGIKYNLVYPNIDLKDEYLKRYENRGSSLGFINLLNSKWNEWIGEIVNQKEEDKPYQTLIELSKGQYINDIVIMFGNMICINNIAIRKHEVS